MPTITIQPSDDTLKDKRFEISGTDEEYLLKKALESGIKKEDIGSFSVIIVVGIPSLVEIERTPAKKNAEGKIVENAVHDYQWNHFTEEELIEEASKSPALFYDKEHQRLIAITPPLPPMPFKIPRTVELSDLSGK
jgi:hypothetical protein